MPQPIYQRRLLCLGRRQRRAYVVRVLTSSEVEAQGWPRSDVWREWQTVLRDGDELIAFEPGLWGRHREGSISGVALLRKGRTLRIEVKGYYLLQRDLADLADSEAAIERKVNHRRLRARIDTIARGMNAFLLSKFD